MSSPNSYLMFGAPSHREPIHDSGSMARDMVALLDRDIARCADDYSDWSMVGTCTGDMLHCSDVEFHEAIDSYLCWGESFLSDRQLTIINLLRAGF